MKPGMNGKDESLTCCSNRTVEPKYVPVTSHGLQCPRS